ncbi:MAG: non-homologous end-joining DNA ligase [Alicyclobacillaceae bacterium]|nr:non-homologous end-joining DNA ligase [Alicyclobacillaceae bacterium]
MPTLDEFRLQAEHLVRITRPAKLLWPQAGVTKARYVRYMAEIAPVLLEHVRDRPLTVIRCPDGVGGPAFYQKHVPPGTPPWVRTLAVPAAGRGEPARVLLADSVATLMWLANQAAVELHVGFTRIGRPDEPDWVAFDLDPSVPGFDAVREVALALHRLLERMELPHLAKTSGATGLQVFIPLTGGHTFAQTRVFTRAVAEYLRAELPQLVTLERLKKDRGHKVYVDYPQHGRSRTLVAAYSPRATPAATVSAPLTWTELERGVRPEAFTIHNMAERVRAVGDLMRPRERASLHRIVVFLERHGVRW